MLLARDARLPPGGVQLLGDRRASPVSASRGISHSSQVLPSAVLSSARSGSRVCLPGLPDDVDLGVVGDGLERDVRRALVDEALADVAVRRRIGLDLA